MSNLSQSKIRKIVNVSKKDESNSCPSLPSSIFPMRNKFSLISISYNESPKRTRLPIPSCFSRQDSNSSMYSLPKHDSNNSKYQANTLTSSESGRSLKLSKKEIELIKMSWHEIPNKHLWCQRLFLKIFSNKEGLKKIMGYDGLTPKELMEYRRFDNHCNRFLDFWQTLLDRLCCFDKDENFNDQNGEKLVNKIREVGYLHCRMPGVTFDAESWLLFKNVILESLYLQHCEMREFRYLAWSKFIMFVIAEMKDAFHEGVRARSYTF